MLLYNCSKDKEQRKKKREKEVIKMEKVLNPVTKIDYYDDNSEWEELQ